MQMGLARGPVQLSWCLTPHMDASGMAIRVAKALALQTKCTAITTDLQKHVLTSCGESFLKLRCVSYRTKPLAASRARAHMMMASARLGCHVCRGLSFVPMSSVLVSGQDVECVEVKVASEGPDMLTGPKVPTPPTKAAGPMSDMTSIIDDEQWLAVPGW